jgi:hypothetical protein
MLRLSVGESIADVIDFALVVWDGRRQQPSAHATFWAEAFLLSLRSTFSETEIPPLFNISPLSQ